MSSSEDSSEQHSDSNWIVSYADMMTLLCIFFILMYTLSRPDPKKIEELRKETSHYFGGVYKLPFQALADTIKKVIKENGLEKIVGIESDETGVTATFHGAVFFDSGKAELLPQGVDVLQKLGAILKKQAPDFKIIVEGHTDDVPIVSQLFPSNWELSGARASRVIRMFESMGFNPSRLTAIGYADTRPVAPNQDAKGIPIPANRAQNRRVVMRILKPERTQ